MKYYPRDLESTIEKYIEKPEIIAIKGPRQTGKTTLMRHLLDKYSKQKDCIFLTLEDREILEIFEQDIKSFEKLYVDDNELIFIDEVQYAEEGGQKLKYLFDKTGKKFIISGSSSLELTYDLGKYLVGRVFEFTLYPFSFSEFLNARDPKLREIARVKTPLDPSGTAEELKSSALKNKLSVLLSEYIVFGGYPRVLLSGSEEEKKEVLKNIVDTYLLKDIKGLLELKTADELLEIAKFLALQIGELLVYKELSNAASLSFSNVKEHLNVLEETFILKLVKPFFTNKRLELVKNPKPYFLDTGLRNNLTSNFSELGSRVDKGELKENFVYSQLLRRLERPELLKYWRTKSQAEVDFVIEQGSDLIPVEVKSGGMKEPKLSRSYYSFIEKYEPETGLVITDRFWSRRDVGQCRVHYLPAYRVVF